MCEKERGSNEEARDYFNNTVHSEGHLAVSLSVCQMRNQFKKKYLCIIKISFGKK